VAFFLTLLLHATTLVGVWVTRPFAPGPVQAKDPDPIQLVFAPPPVPAEEKTPEFFSELPPDRADVAPERPDFLSNVDSRARDRAEGGEEGAMPRLEGDSEAPHVRMDPLGGSPAEASEESPPSIEPNLEGREKLPAVEETSPVVRRAQDSLAQLLRPSGGMDLFQPEMSNPGGNVSVSGDISLNTLAWDYAPWLMRFRRDFTKNWYAPYAYYMGVIHGWNLMELEVTTSGEMIRLNMLDHDGHVSLDDASRAAFESAAPFQPLPDNFPEDTLILRIKLIYPKVPTR